MDVKKKLVELLGSMCCSDLGIDGCDNCKYRYEENCNAKAFADHLIANGVTVQEWIPVTERLPKNYEAVLTFDGRSIHIMAHHHDFKDPFGIVKGNFMGYAPVTHWIPLPEPPKGE